MGDELVAVQPRELKVVLIDGIGYNRVTIRNYLEDTIDTVYERF